MKAVVHAGILGVPQGWPWPPVDPRSAPASAWPGCLLAPSRRLLAHLLPFARPAAVNSPAAGAVAAGLLAQEAYRTANHSF